MTDEQIIQAVRVWARDRLGISDPSARVAPSNGVIGSTPYLTVEYVDDEQLTVPEQVEEPDGEGGWSASHRVTMSVSLRISTFGPGARLMARKLAMGWMSADPTGLALRSAGVHPWSHSPVRSIPSLLDGAAWSERAQLDLSCYSDFEDGDFAVVGAAGLDLDVEAPAVEADITIELEQT